jgi:bacillithiol biosynthesis cysteine-adding enzyme BshC
VNVLTHSYPKDYISETLRKSAWSSDPLGLYPHEGIHSNWESITSSVSSQFGEEQRAELVEIISSQMGEAVSASQRENLESLKKDNTFLAVTGQQIHLGLGPMYVIYKIASAIVLCNDLKRKFTDKNFVPLFWMATEDHDVAEINHVDLFGDRFTCDIDWKTGVGTIPTQDFGGLWDWMRQKFQRDAGALTRIEKLVELYQAEDRNLSSATSHWVSNLFADFGLLILDPNVTAFKKRAIKIFEADLFDNQIFSAFSDQSSEMKKHKISPPAHFRECNLFWFDAHRRERIVKDGDDFVLVDSGEKISNQEMRGILTSTPEHFSPNVLLRPLYQQAILPSIAYIAGPTEYLYWLQTSRAFSILQVSAPALIHRMGGVVVSATQNKKINQLGLKAEELFLDSSDLKSMLVQRISGDNALEIAQGKIELGIKEYLEVLYQWKSDSLVDLKKQSEIFVKSQRKATDEAISKYLATKLSEDAWKTVGVLQNDTFSINNPQERRLNFIQLYLGGQIDWLSEICKGESYDSQSAFWCILLV